jgi:AcrR family transcriptional regulator
MKNSYHHGDLRTALIRAGLEIISESGIDSLTIRNAAQKTGVSHAAPYRHFNSKDEFLIAIALDGFEKLTRSAEKAIPVPGSDPVEELTSICRAYILFAWENPEQYRIMFGPYIKNKVKHGDFYTAYDRAFQRLKMNIEKHGKKSAKTPGDPAMTALSVWSLIHGYSMFLIDNYGDLEKINTKQVDEILGLMRRLLYAREGL